MSRLLSQVQQDRLRLRVMYVTPACAFLGLGDLPDRESVYPTNTHRQLPVVRGYHPDMPAIFVS
jgi:hypothetical protein